MFKQILFVLILSTVLSDMEIFGRVLNNNEEYLPGQDIEQENPIQTRNKRCLDDLLDAMVYLLFDYDDFDDDGDDDDDDNDNDNNSKEDDGVQDICRNCGVIVNNVNHFNLPTPSPVGEPDPQSPALNEDKIDSPTETPNSEVTQNPNTQTTKPATEAAAEAAAEAGKPTTTSTPTVVDGTTIKANEDADIAITTAGPAPQALEGVEV